jgi:hypothetical protein
VKAGCFYLTKIREVIVSEQNYSSKNEPMKLNFNEKSVRDNALQEVSSLMTKALEIIMSGVPEAARFYNETTHNFLMRHAWEIQIPASVKERPVIFKDLRYDDGIPWPQATTYCYVMNVLNLPSVPWPMLNFGYAVHDGKLIRTAFFAHQKLVEYQDMPQSIVVDPLAIQRGIEPDYYVGCPVCSKSYLEGFIINRKQNPFENYVKEKGHLMQMHGV